ncbi:MAG TPA: hypothetical protein PLH83_16915 [Ruminococcus sp.]|nr:hypothetical protein [Ruminococcus sp.]
MGSGSSGPYGSSSSGSGSQPYAPTYHVDSVMHERDVTNGIYHDGHYDKNPTAQNINDMINGNYIGNKNTNIDMPYVIDLNGNIILGRRNGNGRDGLPTPHPTLIGGKDPQVQMAGIVHIHGGKIASYDNQSGHFKPNAKSMQVADEAFGKSPSILFKKKKG